MMVTALDEEKEEQGFLSQIFSPLGDLYNDFLKWKEEVEEAYEIEAHRQEQAAILDDPSGNYRECVRIYCQAYITASTVEHHDIKAEIKKILDENPRIAFRYESSEEIFDMAEKRIEAIKFLSPDGKEKLSADREKYQAALQEPKEEYSLV